MRLWAGLAKHTNTEYREQEADDSMMRLLARKMSGAIVMTGFLAAMAANAADPKFPNWPWVHAGRYSPPNGNGITIWVNMESMRRAGAHALQTWIKYQNDRPDRAGVAVTLVFEKLECDRDWHTTILIMNYSDAGKVLSSLSETPSQAEPIVPDSLLAGIMPFTCAAGGLQH
jgi:hypothetical protein